MAICRKMFLKTLDFSAVADDIKLFVGNLEVGICSKKFLRSKKFKVSNYYYLSVYIEKLF